MQVHECASAMPNSLRAEIELSWRRVRLGGALPNMPVDRLDVVEIDTSSRLMVAARPVLDEMADELTGTRYCVLLADRACRIVDRWFDTATVERALEGISAVPGTQFAEETVGTNGLGTPIELRRGVAVHGDEHFNEALKRFSCYGHPIRHPVTHRIEGVLDITGISTDANPMLGPFLARAVRDVERRLAEGARVSERRLLEAFQRAVQRRSRPLAVLGRDVVLTNRAAVDLLDADDHGTLRALAEESPHRRAWTRQIRFASGALVDVRAERIPGADGGTLFHLDPVDRPHVPIPRGQRTSDETGVDARLRGLREFAGAVLIAGEPGTGRTTAIRTVAGAKQLTVLDATDVATMGEHAWAERFDHLARSQDRVLAIEEFHLLPDTLCGLVSRRLAGWRAAPLVLTSEPPDRLAPLAASVAACAHVRVELPPLRNRIDELPRLIRAQIAELNPAAGLRFTPSALEALSAQAWPGNLRELGVVLRGVLERRSAGDVMPADFPAAYRGTPRAARLAGRERAERGAIVEALIATGGNKARAAERLGISRTTLYSRVRALGVTL
ncbi:MAG: sigma-54-dependent Fis family transcriptional regulator [Haloechinothrix sp.]